MKKKKKIEQSHSKNSISNNISLSTMLEQHVRNVYTPKRSSLSMIDLTISRISTQGIPLISITFHNLCSQFPADTRYRGGWDIHVTSTWLIVGTSPSKQLEEMNFGKERPLKFDHPCTMITIHPRRSSRFRVTSHESSSTVMETPLKERWWSICAHHGWMIIIGQFSTVKIEFDLIASGLW